MVGGAKGVVHTIDFIFAFRMRIAEGKVVAVRHHHVFLRVHEHDAVARLPTRADIVVGQGKVHGLIGVGGCGRHAVEVADISQIIVKV